MRGSRGGLAEGQHSNTCREVMHEIRHSIGGSWLTMWTGWLTICTHDVLVVGVVYLLCLVKE